MDIVLILGDDNSGKSTLVRCLSGLGRGNHRHPSDRNIALLNWGAGKVPLYTFCLISSLNEGKAYPGSRITNNPKMPFGNENTLSPSDLDAILTSYERAGCTKAILCISTTKEKTAWPSAEYLSLIAGGMIGQHRFSAIIGLDIADPGVAQVPFFRLPRAQHPRNDIAANARLRIGLQ